MAVAQRVSGPFMAMGTQDKDAVIIKEQERQLQILGSQPQPEVKPQAPLLASEKSSASKTSQSLRYSSRTLLDLANVQPPIPRHKLRFSEQAPVEVIPWKAFEPRYTNMASYPNSITSDDDDFTNGGVPLSARTVTATSQRTAGSAQSSDIPIRQPKNAPTGIEAQIVEGFNEEHQARMRQVEKFACWMAQQYQELDYRVTAGGRVVPSGPNSPPPTFQKTFLDTFTDSRDGSPRMTNVREVIRDGNDSVNRAKAPYNGREMRSSRVQEVPSKTMPSSKDSNSPRPKIVLPEGCKPVAEMADGSKLIKFGKQLYRAYVNDNGQTAFESLKEATPVASPELESATLVPEDVTPDPNMPEGFIATTGTPYMLVQGPNETWVPATPVTDELGNIHFVQTPTMPAFQDRQLGGPMPHEPIHFLDHNNAIVPYSERYSVPAQPKQQPVLPIEYTGMSYNELKTEYDETCRFYEVKKSRLHSVERWLAKEEDMLDSAYRKDLISQKGQLITSCDQLRKEKIKLERSMELVADYLSQNPQSDPKLLREQEARMPQNFHGHGNGHNGVFIHQHEPLPNTMGVTSHGSAEHVVSSLNHPVNNARMSATSFPKGAYAKSMAQMIAAKHLKPEARPFIPGSGASKESIRSTRGTQQSSDSYALVRMHEKGPSTSSSNVSRDSATAVRSERKKSPTITLRHPDGTPIDLSAMSKNSKSQVGKPQQHVSFSRQSTDKSDDSGNGKTLSSMIGGTQTKSNKGPSWTKLSNESLDEFNKRTEHLRRSNSAVTDNGSKSGHHTENSAVPKLVMPNGVSSNENLHLRKDKSPAKVPKSSSSSSFVQQQTVSRHVTAFPTQLHPAMAPPPGFVIAPDHAMYRNVHPQAHYRGPSHGMSRVVPHGIPQGPSQTRSMNNMMSRMGMGNHSAAFVPHTGFDGMVNVYSTQPQFAIPYQQSRAYHEARPSSRP